jgi:hypothetical protein
MPQGGTSTAVMPASLFAITLAELGRRVEYISAYAPRVQVEALLDEPVFIYDWLGRRCNDMTIYELLITSGLPQGRNVYLTAHQAKQLLMLEARADATFGHKCKRVAGGRGYCEPRPHHF